MPKKPNPDGVVRRAEVRRVEPKTAIEKPLGHKEAFLLAYGEATHQIKRGSLRTRDTDEAIERATACIVACEGLSLEGLKSGALTELTEAARHAIRLLDGRLVRSDPEGSLVRDQLRRAMRKLGLH